MTNEEFMLMYEDSLRHGWVTSKDSSVAAKQKQREKEYNHSYYQAHSRKWREKYAYPKRSEGDLGAYDPKDPKYKATNASEAKDAEARRARNMRESAQIKTNMARYNPRNFTEYAANISDLAKTAFQKKIRKAKNKVDGYLKKAEVSVRKKVKSAVKNLVSDIVNSTIEGITEGVKSSYHEGSSSVGVYDPKSKKWR